MKKKFQKAFDELKAMGVPVFERSDYPNQFLISGEEDNSWEWLDYYDPRISWDMEMVNPELTQILEKHGLHAEWENPGCLIVYED